MGKTGLLNEGPTVLLALVDAATLAVDLSARVVRYVAGVCADWRFRQRVARQPLIPPVEFPPVPGVTVLLSRISDHPGLRPPGFRPERVYRLTVADGNESVAIPALLDLLTDASNM